MANLKIDLNKEVSLGKSRGAIPTKTSINLVVKKESFLKSKKALPTIILGVLVVVLIVGFFLVKPLISLASANARISDLQAQLDETNKTIESMGYIEEEYAHYTTEGMTAKEISRVDRVKVMKLVEDSVVHSGVVKSWNLSENTMALEVRGASLSELNQIAGALEEEPIVDRCVITTANKGDAKNEGNVAVSFIVYLNDAETAAKVSEAENTEEGQEQ